MKKRRARHWMNCRGKSNKTPRGSQRNGSLGGLADGGEGVACVGVGGIERKRSAKLGDGVIHPVDLEEHPGRAVMGVGGLGVDLERLAVVKKRGVALFFQESEI